MAEHPRWTDYMPLVEIRRHAKNPKGHDQATIGASIRRFGFIEPIVMDERTMTLISGHGRLDELEAAAGGDDTPDPPDGIVLDDAGRWCAPVSRGWSSANDDEAAAALVALNQTTILGGWEDNGRKLHELLDGLRTKDTALLAGTGYTSETIDNLLAGFVVPQFAPVPSDAQPRLDVRNPVVCPACGHSFHRV